MPSFTLGLGLLVPEPVRSLGCLSLYTLAFVMDGIGLLAS